jgi:tRNA 2-thiouridine synthesizing protein A
VPGAGGDQQEPLPPWQHRPPWEQAQDPDGPPWALAAGGGMLGAPTLEDVTPDAAAPLVSPVTDEAREASAASAALLPSHIPAGSEPVVTIDALGRKCPIPIIMLAEQIRDVPVGAVIAVLADDPAAYSDIPAWCGLKSHDCAFRAGYATGWSFGVRRRY